MVTVIQVAGLTVTAVLIAKTLESYAKEQAMLLTLLVGIILTASAAAALAPVLQRIDSMLSLGGLSAEQTALLSKAIGICLITEFASEICRDAGESAMRSAVLLAGKATLLLLSLPLVDPLLRTLREVVS